MRAALPKDRRGEATVAAPEVLRFHEATLAKASSEALLLAANVYKMVGQLEEVFEWVEDLLSLLSLPCQAEKWLLEAQEIFEDLGERRLCRA